MGAVHSQRQEWRNKAIAPYELWLPTNTKRENDVISRNPDSPSALSSTQNLRERLLRELDEFVAGPTERTVFS